MSHDEHNSRPIISTAVRTIATEIANEMGTHCIERLQQVVEAAKLDDAHAYEVLQHILAGIVTKALTFKCNTSIPCMQQFAGEFVDTLEIHINDALNASSGDHSWH